MTTTNNYYRTSDTPLASFLIISGFPLQGIDYSQPRFEFIFVDTKDLRELASQYISGRALTEPISFDRINKKLLRIIRNQKQWGED